MILSILADQPNSPVTRTHGESVTLYPTRTFSTLSARIFLMSSQRGEKAAFYSSNFFLSSSESFKSRPALEQFLSFLPSYSLSY
jgi:hypothetical protein